MRSHSVALSVNSPRRINFLFSSPFEMLALALVLFAHEALSVVTGSLNGPKIGSGNATQLAASTKTPVAKADCTNVYNAWVLLRF